MNSLYCPSCGKQNEYEAKFCNNCAKPLVDPQRLVTNPLNTEPTGPVFHQGSHPQAIYPAPHIPTPAPREDTYFDKNKGLILMGGASLVVVLLLILAVISSTTVKKTQPQPPAEINISNQLLPEINMFLNSHKEFGKPKGTESIPDWAKGKRQRVIFEDGKNLLFYTKENQVVTIYEDTSDGRKRIWGEGEK